MTMFSDAVPATVFRDLGQSRIPKHRRYDPRRGQTLVIAIMVMFILAVVAAVFIALVARNMFRSERSSRADSVAQIAEAGIRYADEMLTTSEEGADWRPVPDGVGCADLGNVIANIQPTPDTAETFAPGMPNWQYLRDRHPDFKWVRPYWPVELPAGSPEGMGFAGPSGGFTTINEGGGRFLLRVSYNPNPRDPVSKYIKIESIGRWGEVLYDPNTNEFDPTTLKGHGYDQLRREITAFKPIGITDYLRFVTNKDNRETQLALGCPGFVVDFGRSTGSRFGQRGAPLRVNGNLVLYGGAVAAGAEAIRIYLRGIHEIDSDGQQRLVPIDRWEVAGDITFADQDLGVMLRRIVLGTGAPSEDGPFRLKPSRDPSFRTELGFYRDGQDSTDTDRMARGVRRIEPPLVDQPDPTGTTTRYRLLTLNSGERIPIRDAGGRVIRWINLGLYGWGRGVYINNLRDRQRESETLPGFYTLRADWLKPNNPMSTYWKGPYYVPPACVITLNPGDTDGDAQPDFTITRDDISTAAGRKAVWVDASGRERPEWGATIKMPYPDPTNGRILTAALGGDGRRIEGNGVIFAEGNIRIRGMLPRGMQLTVVSNQNIYIEGSLLKYREPGAQYGNDPFRGADTSCGLALLARENVCVNTTQFFSPLNSIDDYDSDAMDGSTPFHLRVTSDPASQIRCAFEFAPWESDFGTQPSVFGLYLRHSGEFGPSYINAWLNPASTLPLGGLLTLNQTFPGLPNHVWGVGDPNFSAPGWGIGSSFVGDAFRLDAANNATLLTDPGFVNILQIGLDQTTFTSRNYWMGGLAIQPFDVRIEAVIYAQEGSFFVLPGNWFNPNPADRFDPNRPRPAGMSPRFPFFGQPLDIRIIVDGAVSENLPAAISDVEEWMAKWGRIPDKYGSTDEPTAHPGEGFTILYDDHVGWPLADLGNPTTPIRTDRFGRVLPIAPRLPVCGTLIYFGDVM